MGEMARLLILTGVILIVIGLVILGGQKFPFLGKLPGDIMVKRENFTVYLPFATSILISIIISVILYLINKSR
jgi:hypothetical protein